jgi:hypothetical protein
MTVHEKHKNIWFLCAFRGEKSGQKGDAENVRPMVDDIELELVQEITTYDLRNLAEHKPPGMDGSLLQNLGRRPTRLVLWGIATGPEALQTTQELDEKFRAAEPVSFTADIVNDAEIQTMFIDDLKIQDLAGKPERFAYVLTLREFIEPVEPATTAGPLDASALGDALGDLDTDILGDALAQLENLTSGLEILEELSDVIAQLTQLTAELQQSANQV